MKKALCLFISFTLILSCMGTAFAEEVPSGLLIRQYRARYGTANPPADHQPAITPTWQNGRCTFVDPDGISVYSYTPYTASIVPYARVLISEDSFPLPESGMYYERLYTSKSISSYKFKQYMTGGWAKADNYTVTSSATVEWSHSGSLDLSLKKAVVAHYSLNYSQSTGGSIGTSIPADPSRYSKLGLFVKYVHNDISYQTIVVRDGQTVSESWEYGKTDNPYDYRFDPVYQA